MGPSAVVTLQVILFLFVLWQGQLVLGGLVTIDIVPFNNNDNLTEITINACSTSQQNDLLIVDSSMTWPEAMAACKDLGYETVMPASTHYLTRKKVRRYLDMEQYQNSNYSFWTGVFRPYYHVKKWYRYSSRCVQFQSAQYPQGNFTDGQCSIIRRTSFTSGETAFIEDCTNLHPFVCSLTISGIIYTKFEGFNVNIQTLDTARLKSSNDIDISTVGLNLTFLQQCFQHCAQTSSCNGFTYNATNSSSPECIFIQRSEYQYNISAMPNMTHYAKSNCNISWYNDAIQPNTNFNVAAGLASFSNCGVDEIPTSYDRCATELHLVTIDKKETGKYQRRLSCANDDRPSCSRIGAFGVAILIAFMSVFPTLDKVVPCANVTKKEKQNMKK